MFFFYTYVMFLFTASAPKTVEGKRLNEVFTSKLISNNKVHQITEIEVLAKDDDQQTPRRQLQSNLMKKAGHMCYGLNGATQSIMAGRFKAGTDGNEACTTLPTTQGAWEYLSIAPLKVGLAKAGNTYIVTPDNVQLIEQATEKNAPDGTHAPMLEVAPTLASVENGKAFVANVGALFGSYYGYTAADDAIDRDGPGATAADGPFGFLGFQAGIAVEELSYSTSTFQATVINPVNANNRERTMNACVLPLLSGNTCPAAKTAKEGTLKYSFYGYFGGNKWANVITTNSYTQLVARNTFDVTQMASATEQDKIKICYDVEDDEDATKCQKISEVPLAGKAFTKNLFVRGAADADESGVNVEFSKNVNYGQIKKAAGVEMNGEELSSMATFDGASSILSSSSPNGVTFALHRDATNKLYIDIQVPVTGTTLAKNGGYFIYDPTVSGAAEKSVVTALFMSFMVSLWAMM